MDSLFHSGDPLTMAGFLTTKVKQIYTNGSSQEKIFEDFQIAILLKLIIFIIYRPFSSSHPLILSLFQPSRERILPQQSWMWMLEGCAALVHSGVVVLIITPQRPSKKDFCSIYLIDPGVSPHNSVCFYRHLPPPFPDPSVSQLSIISMCIIVAITCQGKKKKDNFLYFLVQREKMICCKV